MNPYYCHRNLANFRSFMPQNYQKLQAVPNYICIVVPLSLLN